MYLPDISGERYETPAKRYRRFSSRRLFKGPFWFYARYILLVLWSGVKFLYTRDPQKAVKLQALRVMRIVENQGAHLTFEGLDRYPASEGPYVFACNHMGTLEVNALPGLVASRLPMTFVVKESLIKMPFFGQILKRLNAIPVERKHPGQDLMQVLKVGEKLLSQGISVILFPEGTRQDVFSSARFNSLAVKLAIKADVPVVPVALRTDFWGVGKKVKEFGPLNFDRSVNIQFGHPIKPEGRGRKEHLQVVDFIAGRLTEWGSPVDVAQD
ncbi:MAG: lysophospholipid acyltransferase family protein [Spirochaetaceae bacterium]|nr:lysophospholipid acyltransferase family protein [Spirochaetaceae bacterium]MDT8296994.1 lysophospholipid acyltransferase family protein [Spirochaetaceae bacterium]